MTTFQDFTVRSLSESGAAEIVGLDATRIDEPETFAALKRAFLAHPILAIRDANLTVAKLAAFSRLLGRLDPNTPRPELTHPDDREVLILSNEIRPDGTPVGVVDAGEEWHSDLSFRAAPAMATILQLVKRPNSGGDTEYCNMYQVYDSLPERLRHRIAGLKALHHLSKLRNPRVAISQDRPGAKEYYSRVNNDSDCAVHPVVRTHPETGRQALFVTERFAISIEALDDAEGQALLDELFGYMNDRRFHYRHKWQDGDLVMWDNRCLAHRACGGYGLDDIRRLHRTCVLGDVPFYRPLDRF